MTGYRIIHGKTVRTVSDVGTHIVKYKCVKCRFTYPSATLQTHYRWKRHRLILCSGSTKPGVLVAHDPLRYSTAFNARLYEMTKLEKGWNSYDADPPTKLAVSIARDLGSRLYAADLPPSRVVPLAIGGVAIFLQRAMDDRIVDIEVDNDGDIIVCIGKDGKRIFQLKSEGELNEAIKEISGYFEKPVDVSENSQ